MPRCIDSAHCGEEIDDEIEIEIERKKKTVNGGLHRVRTMDCSTKIEKRRKTATTKRCFAVYAVCLCVCAFVCVLWPTVKPVMVMVMVMVLLLVIQLANQPVCMYRCM